jgi:uncharacterized protein with HEPN domain
MLHKSDKAKLVKIMKYIGDIQIIIDRHRDVSLAFDDIEGQHAIMMCLLQIGEMINRLNEEVLREKLEAKKIIAFRNIVAHEYDTVDKNRTVHIISNKIPEMKTEIMSLLSGEEDFSALEKLWQR